MAIIKSFRPLIGNDAEILILGTMPGNTSLQQHEYYAYKHNHFWKLIYAVFDQPPQAGYPAKVKYIKDNKIALWDVLSKCRRDNTSADTAIRREIPNNITKLLAEHSSIRDIFFNGKQAEKYFHKYFKGPFKQRLHLLPSTSPANAQYTFEQKLRSWRIILKNIY